MAEIQKRPTSIVFAFVSIATLCVCGDIFSRLLPCADGTTVTLHDLTEYEKDILDEFRRSVIHLIHKEYMKTDAYLLRWLNVADFDLDDAVQRLKKSLAWRKEKNIDSIISESYTFIDEAYPVVVDGTDKDGRPVIYANLGSYDFRQIAISGQERTYQRYSIRLFELFEEYMHYLRGTSGLHNVTQITCIYDLSGFNLKQGGCYKCVKMLPESILNFEPNYPGVFHRIFLINCPAIFYNVISLARNFLSEQSKEAVQLFGYDKAKWSQALLDQIPPGELSVQYGGQRVISRDKASFAKNRLIQAIQDKVRVRDSQILSTTENEVKLQPPIESELEALLPTTGQESGATNVQYTQVVQENRSHKRDQDKATGMTTKQNQFDLPRQQHHHHYKPSGSVENTDVDDDEYQHRPTHHFYMNQHDEPVAVSIDAKNSTSRHRHGHGASSISRIHSNPLLILFLRAGIFVFVHKYLLQLCNFY